MCIRDSSSRPSKPIKQLVSHTLYSTVIAKNTSPALATESLLIQTPSLQENKSPTPTPLLIGSCCVPITYTLFGIKVYGGTSLFGSRHQSSSGSSSLDP